MNKGWKMAIIVAALLAMPLGAWARIKLAALPERSDVVIRLDHPDATLVEEDRVLTLQKGINRVDFSWTGVRIDPDSIRLTVLSHPGQVTLLNVSYPPDEDALVWEIGSGENLAVTVRVSYLLAGIDRLTAYKAVSDTAETRLDLKAFLVLRNFSGEDFDRAKVGIGTAEPLGIGIRHEETRRFQQVVRAGIPIEKTLTFDSAFLPWDPELQAGNVGLPVHYVLTNRPQAAQGAPEAAGAPLRPGKVRVFQNGPGGGTVFLGEDRIDLTPAGEEVKIGIGESRDVKVTQRKMASERINLRYNRKRNRVVLYDLAETITAETENFKKTPARVILVQHIPGQWEMKACNLPYELKDAETLLFDVTIPAGGKTALSMEYVLKNLRR